MTHESRRPRRDGDTVGAVDIVFVNAIGTGRKLRHRPDIDTARALVAHYRPYNNTDLYAAQVTAIDGDTTWTTSVDLRIDGRYVSCPCPAETDVDCTEATR